MFRSVDDSTKARIRATDWLRHRWPFTIRTHFDCGRTWHIVHVGPLDFSRHETADLARGWINRARPASLAVAIDNNPEFAGGQALIEGGRDGARLARIPPRLWVSYDAFPIARTARNLTLISAKARALFPDTFAVFVRVYPPVPR